MNIAIIILAAGSSSRMKEPKQLLTIRKKTLLGIAIENALNSKCSKVFCVLGANAELIKNSINNYEIETIVNTEYNKGLSSSIIKGIEHIKPKLFDAAIIMLADQPNLHSDYLDKLIKIFKANQEKIIASNYSGINGVPAIFPKRTFQQLLKLNGDKGAKEFLNSGLIIVKSIQSKDELIDIDTKHDYNKYLEKNTN
ncbi:NTP transferase domain-containing protein [Winogradskyella sp. PE311]|uniref:nucleotidyltransferase family protein n=1 Tax=Winogradskyella sp. PE311 TaxID=3366943 RepID=UPI0039801E13